MIVLAPIPCDECDETVYVKAERAVEIVDDDKRLTCTMHT